MRIFKLGTMGAALLTLFAEGTAFAQVPPPAPPPADPAAPPPPADPAAAPAAAPAPAPAADANATATAQAGGDAQVGMALPGAAPAPAAAPGTSDHDGVVGRFAVGYLGRRSMSIGGTPADPLNGVSPVEAPVIGVRYWLDQMLGLDLGLGFAATGGSNETDNPTPAPDVTTDEPSGFAFILHGGVPLALANTGHFSFQITPEMNLGVASASLDEGGTAGNWSGFHLDVGARAGAEIHFGFIDIPQLSLQGSVGLAFALDSTSASIDPAGPAGETKVSHSDWRLATSVQDNPWNIFTSNVAALYYF